jgi:hypothetical protein
VAAHQVEEEGVRREREEGEGDHLSARRAMVLSTEPSKGQNHEGVVALTRFLGVEMIDNPYLFPAHKTTQARSTLISFCRAMKI